MKDDVVFRIKNKEGLYSTGGNKPKFVKHGGKVWLSLAAIKLHLRQFSPKYRKHNFSNDEYNEVYERFEKRNPIPNDWIVVELTESGNSFSAKGVLGIES